MPGGRKGCRAWLPSYPLKPLNLRVFPYAPGWPAGCKQVTAPKIAEVPQCRVQRRTSVPRPQSRLRHGRKRRRRPKTTPRTTAAAPLRPWSTPPQPLRTPRIRSRRRNRPPHARPRRPISPRRNSPPAAPMARPARPRARRRTRRRPPTRRKTRTQQQHRWQVQTLRSIQARARTRRPIRPARPHRPTSPARQSTLLPGQRRLSSLTQRRMPLHRIPRQKPHRTTRTTAAVRPIPAPPLRQRRPTSRHSPLQRPLSPIRSSIRRRQLRLRRTR